jgi:hypothetical protein
VSSDPPLFDAEHRAAVARKVAARRVKRRLKAAASIGLALMAGAFLACSPDKPQKEKSRVPVPPNPTTPSVGALPPRAPSARVDSGSTASAGSAGPDASGRPHEGAGPSASSTAIVPVAKTPHKAPSVDKQEHRKGMPVPDNLLE